MGFAEGLRAGTSLANAIYAEERAQKQDAMQAEKFGWERRAQERLQTKQGLQDEAGKQMREAWDRVQAANRPAPGVNLTLPEQREGLQTVGDVASQVVPAATGFKLGTSAGIPSAPVGSPTPAVPVSPGQAGAAIAGTATAPTVRQQASPGGPYAEGGGVSRGPVPYTPSPTAPPMLGQESIDAQLAFEKAAGKYSLASDDAAGARQAMANLHALNQREIINNSAKEFMAMSPENRQKRAFSPNITNQIPMLTLGTDKNGMLVVPVDPKTGQPTVNVNNPIKLSWDQAAQLHAAEELARRGYGAEAIELASKVNAKIGESIKAHNEMIMGVQKGSNEAIYHGMTAAESVRHHKAMEGYEATKTRLLQDKAKAENNDIVAVSKEGITTIDKKSNKITTQPWPKGTSDEHKEMYIKKFAPAQREWKALGTEGNITNGASVMAPNPYFGMPKEKVPPGSDTSTRYIDVTPGGGGDDIDKAWAAKTGAGGGKGGAPGAGGPKPATANAPSVPGRPFYNADQRELQRMATKPVGVSTEEANAARAEMEQRRGEGRMRGL